MGEVLKRAKIIEERNMYALRAEVFDVVKDKSQEADYYRLHKFL